MAADTDKFIVAMFALWAGDFSYCDKLLREFSPPRRSPRNETEAHSPEDFIRISGALRLRQLWQKRGEFKKLASHYNRAGFEVRTKHCIFTSLRVLGLDAFPHHRITRARRVNWRIETRIATARCINAVGVDKVPLVIRRVAAGAE